MSQMMVAAAITEVGTSYEKNSAKLLNPSTGGRMNKEYYDQTKQNSQCKACSRRPITVRVVFQKEDWFRGNDTYLGKFCKDCYKTLFETLPSESTPKLAKDSDVQL
jgi:hypothetical protein